MEKTKSLTDYRILVVSAPRAVGKKALLWKETSRLWKQANPPDDYGHWYCKVGGSPLTDKASDETALRLNLCHDLSRARRPDMAYNLDNIFPGCQRHNKEQGSKSLDEYLKGPHSEFCGNF